MGLVENFPPKMRSRAVCQTICRRTEEYRYMPPGGRTRCRQLLAPRSNDENESDEEDDAEKKEYSKWDRRDESEWVGDL